MLIHSLYMLISSQEGSQGVLRRSTNATAINENQPLNNVNI